MILIINCGSQSFKYKVFEKSLVLLAEKKITIKKQSEYRQKMVSELAKIKKNFEIEKVGHRVVHGGSQFRKPVIVNNKILASLKKYDKLAPLHNPFNILGIKEALRFFPKAQQTAVFDTGFFENLPKEAFIYALPEKIREKYGFRKFGFHGISHEYAAKTAAQELKVPFKKAKIITCHLGGGSSMAAIKNGEAIDTSMGFTPLEGLTMMTRAGDLDPGIVLELCKTFSINGADNILNKESGLKGICGLSDMKDILKKASRGDKKANLALKIFTYRIQKYIGSYYAVLGGCDILVFTGMIGAGSAKIRQMICGKLNILKSAKKTKIIAVEPDEELAIAQKI